MKQLICLLFGLSLLCSATAFGQNNIAFTTSRAIFSTGEEIYFRNISSKAFSDSIFTWNFGEDCGISPVFDPLSCYITSKGLESVTYSFHTPGTYQVSLILGYKTYTQTIEVLPGNESHPAFSAKESFDNNLIGNYSFESYANCPDKPGQLYNTLSFYSPTPATPDYFNGCYTDKAVYDWKMDVPENFAGNSDAKEGNAYAGIINFIIEDTVSVIQSDPASKYHNYREYIQAKLSYPLVQGETYVVQCYVKLSSKSRVSATIGMLLSTAEIKYSQASVLPDLQPQLLLNELPDTSWSLISDTIVANDNYEYLVIGNFKDDQNSDLKDIRPDSLLTSKYGNFRAYVSYTYIDAVRVSHIFNESRERYVIASAGGSFSGDDVQVDFTVGQRALHTLTTTSIICTQGFQQPVEDDIAFRRMPANSLVLNSIIISAYPNPFDSKVQVQITNKLQNDVCLELYDLFGKKHINQIVHIRDAEINRLQLDLEHIPAGIYNLVISNSKDIGTYKLVKQ
jgi:hypothetical protein